MDLNKLPVAHGAEFNSNLNQYENDCLPGTREDLLHDILAWARLPQGKCIFWLNGRAGTGKSTISRTVAKTFNEANLLGASFFFKRGEGDRGNTSKFFPTITRQLAKRIPQLIPTIQKAIDDDPDIATKGLKEQFDKILLRPLIDLNSSTLLIPFMVVVIDALDECEVDNDMRLILQLLPRLQKSNSVRFRIFIASRPELPIRLGFSKIAPHDYEVLCLDKIPEHVIERDISLFLKHRLSDIRTERCLPVNWPKDADIHRLTALSSPLFIFAATACRLLEDPHWDPVESLAEILTYRNNGPNLDGIYLPVLNRLLNGQSEKQRKRLVQEFQEVIGTIVILQSPLSVKSLSRLIGFSDGLIRIRLSPLHSLLNVPDNETLPVQPFHMSFRHFLVDPESGKENLFWVDEKEMHQRLTTRCLLICEGLKKNLCRLPNYGTRRTEIDCQTINCFLPPDLQYSCHYWAHHLVQSKELNAVMHDAYAFLQKHLLHWMEAMSILGLLSEVLGILNLLQSAEKIDRNLEFSEILRDAKRFFLKNWQIADDMPLQLYSTGLVFTPTRAIVRKNFGKELPDWISTLPEVEQTWSAELQTLEGHSDAVYSVAFAPNGHLLASGSYDKTVKLWDTATGALQQTLEGHSDSCRSVAFSPDSRFVASGSFDKTVKIWNAVTASLQQSLVGHLGAVYSVTFSNDGRLLASGSEDMTVRLWDMASGTLQQVLKGHSHLIYSVAFYADSRMLASSSYDNTVRLWNTTTGVLQQTLEGHSGWVCSIAFSANGQLLASGSSDKTIKLWDIATGNLQRTLKGQDGFQSVAFLPTNHTLASGSLDKTIRLWNTTTGELQQTLEGHSIGVRSIAFSPDGRLLASSSQDKTVRLWDIAIEPRQHALQKHSHRVRSIAFSPDGRLLASGSDDAAVKLWDIGTGCLQQTLHTHSSWVWSVVFSSDGRILASCSEEAIKLWNIATGAVEQSFLIHTGGFRSVAFSADDQLLVTGSCDKIVRLWDTATGALQQTFEGHSGWVWAVAFSANSKLVASGSDDKTVRLWDTATGALRQTLEGHLGWVRSLAFSSNGRRLASSSDDKTVRLWDTMTGTLQQTLEIEGVVKLQFSDDGSYLTTNLGPLSIQSRCEDNNPHPTQTSPQVLLQELCWITLGGKKALRLPPDFRPFCSAFRDGILALGHPSGRISIIGFSTP
ncbi:NACHT and WD40 domain protein [Aspergillus udagawae]|uniref:NACHT and WD40 domain protein n=1 Tax=Aspergillus udagawae TaxID=91492 RepID=A0A8H3S8B3_9EURO|nr:NACHT and WD40 domain protein [Aspergillus udagawae]